MSGSRSPPPLLTDFILLTNCLITPVHPLKQCTSLIPPCNRDLAYISINYEIVIIYIVASLTFLYCIVSIIMYFFSYKSTPEDEDMRLTNSSLAVSSFFLVIFSTITISEFRKSYSLAPELWDGRWFVGSEERLLNAQSLRLATDSDG